MDGECREKLVTLGNSPTTWRKFREYRAYRTFPSVRNGLCDQ